MKPRPLTIGAVLQLWTIPGCIAAWVIDTAIECAGYVVCR